MKYLAVLGRQPEISIAELAALFDNVEQQSSEVAFFRSKTEPELARLGGSLKLAKSLENISPEEYLLQLPDGKITLGVSDYTVNSKNYSLRDIKNISQYGIKIKQVLKRKGRSVRLLPNSTPVISTAAAHHNGLGGSLKKVELIKFRDEWFMSIGVQNITAYKERDQARPARDAKVGMLPPKLAQILINLCGPLPETATILDPFCGTGVVLQEALLMGYNVYGTDKDERMVKYAEKNMEWLVEKGFKGHERRSEPGSTRAEVGDATNHRWQAPISAVAAEIYLGPPMSKPPVEIKLKTVKQECGAILTEFLKNLHSQIAEGTPVTLAIPAWRRLDGHFERLISLDFIEELGYNVLNKSEGGLLYARENQVVAREIIVLRKK
ncbi:hypothetical protein IKF27_02370 [Candidatus Saccharibacteria bacterium]|nr:hypothetical protein [Candidatus Saccharibacteria bacterium]